MTESIKDSLNVRLKDITFFFCNEIESLKNFKTGNDESHVLGEEETHDKQALLRNYRSTCAWLQGSGKETLDMACSGPERF